MPKTARAKKRINQYVVKFPTAETMRTKNLTAKTSKNQKPNPHLFYGDNYERGTDPFHVSAAPIHLKDDPAWNQGERKAGWYLLDHWKNQIGFIADGTIIQVQAANQTRKKGRENERD